MGAPSSNSFFVATLELSIFRRSCRLQIDNVTPSVPIWMTFISFSYSVALARTSSTKLSGSSGPFCLVLDLREKHSFSLTTLSIYNLSLQGWGVVNVF